jgi:hypothetical protein
MQLLNIITGLLVLLNVAAAFLTSFGKKHLKRTVVRLERTRDERRAKLLVVAKRRKSMDGTRNYLRNRREEMIDAIIKGKEDIERYESNGPGDAVAESAEDQAEAGEAMLDEDKKISSWVDTASKEGREAGGTDQDKDIKTRFPASERGEDLFK